MENKDRRIGWLKELKVGDNVFIRSSLGLKLGTVTKITPTGRITVFNSTFSHMGRAGSGFSVIRLEEATPEKISQHIEGFQKSKMVKLIKENISKINFENLDLGDLEELVDISNQLVKESSGQ
jgi:hypothetical protein